MPQLKLARRQLDLSEPLVMGVLNVTPDSFSDGGRWTRLDDALFRAEQMLSEGAAIIDVGGESTRPGAQAVAEPEELARVVPVIEAIKSRFDCVISIDTFKPGVMDAACTAGAEIVNDIRALESPGAAEVVLRHQAAACLMHMQGLPQTMQRQPRYGNVLAEIAAYLRERAQAAISAGISSQSLMLDPGIGFGKTLEHNLSILAQLSEITALGFPVLVGVSRKSMFGRLLGREVGERLPASLAAAAMAVGAGAAIIRAHDVRATADAIKVARAIEQHRGSRTG